eukprot:gene33061-42772_t
MVDLNSVDLLIAWLTPTLVSLCKEANVNFFVINSDDAPPCWVQSPPEMESLKPAAAASSWLGLQQPSPDFSQCTCVGNVDNDEEYLYRLSKGDFFNAYFAILADSHGFQIISAQNGAANGNHYHHHHHQQQMYGWAAPGSRNALLDNTTDNNNQNNNVTYALKAVLTSTNSSESYSVLQLASSEFEFLCASANIPQIMPVVPGSYRQLDGFGFRSVGYLMAVVGEPVPLLEEEETAVVSPDTLLKVLSSLHAVHLTGRYHHGDAHVNNAVMVSGEVVWIDACWARGRMRGGKRKQEEATGHGETHQVYLWGRGSCKDYYCLPD